MSISSRPPLYLSGAAKFLGISEKTVRRLVGSGDLPAYRLAGNGRLRFLQHDLDNLLVRVPTVVHPSALQGGESA